MNKKKTDSRKIVYLLHSSKFMEVNLFTLKIFEYNTAVLAVIIKDF